MTLEGGCHTFQHFVSEFSDAFECLVAFHVLGRVELKTSEGCCRNLNMKVLKFVLFYVIATFFEI